jgi:hypothetical protein
MVQNPRPQIFTAFYTISTEIQVKILNSFNEGRRISLTKKSPLGNPSKSHDSTLGNYVQYSGQERNPKTIKSIQMINCRDKIYKSLLPHWTGIQGKEPEAVFKENRGCRTLYWN